MKIENAEATTQLRLLDKEIVFEFHGDIKHQTTRVLQQAWKLTPADGSAPYLKIEWRDVPIVHERDT